MNEIINCHVYVVQEGTRAPYIIIEKEGVRMPYSQPLENIEKFGEVVSMHAIPKIRKENEGWKIIIDLEPSNKIITEGSMKYLYKKLSPEQQIVFYKGYLRE